MRAGKIVLAVALLGIVGLGVYYGRVVWDFAQAGFFSKPPEKREYDGSTVESLKALHTAALLHLQSDGVFPEADKWVDQLEIRVQTADMKKGEALKKFVNPAVADAPDEYGFAINDAAAGKFYDAEGKVEDDFADPSKTVLIYETDRTERNAHGDPAKDGRPEGVGITVSGDIVRLSEVK